MAKNTNKLRSSLLLRNISIMEQFANICNRDTGSRCSSFGYDSEIVHEFTVVAMH